GIPERLQQLIDQWVGRLSERAHAALEAAAVAGGEFSVDLLAGALGMRSEAVVELLDEAAARSLVQRLPGSSRRYAFGHDLIAESLCASRPATRAADPA